MGMKSTCVSTKRLDGKVAIVTGANSGIGFETAANLARRGATVIMACRNSERASNARQEIIRLYGVDSAKETAEEYLTHVKPQQLHIEIVDLASLDSIREFASRCVIMFPEIDFLVNNAGLSCSRYQETVHGHEMTMASNHLGPFLLTEQLLPCLQRAAARTGDARIICVSSYLHHWGVVVEPDLKLKEADYGERAAYQNSKLANVMHVRELAKRLHDTNIRVYSVHPGLVYTNIWKGPMKILSFFTQFFMKTPLEGAQTLLYCVLTDGLENGGYFADCGQAEICALAKNDELCAKVWDISSRLTAPIEVSKVASAD